MKVVLKKLMGLVSFTIIFVMSYLAFKAGIIEAINTEINRYDGINPSYLYIFFSLIFLSYFVGWAKSRFRIQGAH